MPSGYTREQHLDAFRIAVADLCELAACHCEERVRHAASNALSSFAMLKGRPGGPDTLEGPEVVKVIEHAITVLHGPVASARVN